MRKIVWKKQLKIWIMLMWVLLFLVIPVFAADQVSPETTSTLEKIKNILMWIGDLVSRLWVILGNVAGKLMTNAMVYGEFMNLDTYLWKIRHIARNFVNYAIWLFFLYSILRYMIIPSAKEKSPTSLIKELLVTSILVQASWFLVMAVVDISTIWLATISSFPSQLIANNEVYKTNLITQLKSNKFFSRPLNKPAKGIMINAFSDRYIEWDKEQWWEEFELKDVPSNMEERLVDGITPNAKSLAGPLLYMGFSVFKTHEFAKETPISDSDSLEYITKFLILVLFDAGMIILYTFALAILVGILIVRVLYLRVFIALSPVIIFLYGFKSSLKLWNLISFLDIEKVLKLIFQPVLFALWMSLMFVFVVVMQGFFNSNPNSLSFANESMKIRERETLKSDKTKMYSSEMEIGEVIKVNMVQWTKSFKDIVLALLALAMMWYFVKLAVTTKTGISSIDTFTSNTVDMTERALWNAGIIPTPAWSIGLRQIWDGNSSPLIDKGVSKLQTRNQKIINDGIDDIRSLFGGNPGIRPLNDDQKSKLKKLAKTPNDELITAIWNIKTENRWISFSEIKPYLPLWINTVVQGWVWGNVQDSFWGAQSPGVLSEGEDNYETSLKNFFTKPGVASAFYQKVLWGTENVITYEQLNGPTYGTVKVEN